MDNFLAKLDGRIKERQVELAELQTARRVYQALGGEATPSAATSTAASTSATAPAPTVISPFADRPATPQPHVSNGNSVARAA